MGWENLLGFMFSCLFTHYKVVKREIFTTVLEKHKLNSAHIHKFRKKPCKITI